MVRVIFRCLLLISICSFSIANERDLVESLKSKGFMCDLQKDKINVTSCKKVSKDGMIAYYLKDETINVAVSKTIDIKNKYDRKEVLNSLTEYCDYAFDNVFGDKSGFLKEMLQENIDITSNDKNFAYSAISHDPSTYEMKLITVSALEQKGKFDTDVGLLCFISPSPVLY